MKVLLASQIRNADAITIEKEPIDSYELMKRASSQFTKWYKSRFPDTLSIAIFCGAGNNGGDGLLVAQQLKAAGYRVNTYLLRKENYSPDNIKAQKSSNLLEIEEFNSREDVIIDALLGTGISSSLQGELLSIIEHINQSKAIKIALDNPTGLATDSFLKSTCFKADYTATFQNPKLGQLLTENGATIGQLSILNIGLDKPYLDQIETDYHLVDDYFIKKAIYKKRNWNAHKGVNGHALICAGTQGMIGAAILSIKACVYSGAGKVTLFGPQSALALIMNNCPEALLKLDNQEYLSNLYHNLDDYQSIAIGPGIGKRPETKKVLIQLLKEAKQPIIIDADALNLISEDSTLQRQIPKDSILTPHLKEFERLVGKWKNDFEKLQRQIQFSKERQVYITLKGRFTTITTPNGQVYFNSTGNPGMASGGTGDVLTGIITALFAQGYNSLEASVLGCFIHGRAADLALKEESFESITATKIIDHLGKAFKSITK